VTPVNDCGAGLLISVNQNRQYSRDFKLSTSKKDGQSAYDSSREGYRQLWVAVVLQAQDDIKSEPLDSINYLQAVSFFTGGGEWAHTRAAISDHLNLHPDDLERCGRKYINARRAEAGLEALPPRERRHRAEPQRQPAIQGPSMASDCIPQPPAPLATQEVSTVRRSTSDRLRRKRPTGVNPFFPNGVPLGGMTARDAA